MVKTSKELRNKIKKAEKKARKDVLASANKPKRKKKASSSTTPQQKNPSSRWVTDEWGWQGEVFFDGKVYWLQKFKWNGKGYEAWPVYATEEKWEEYKKNPQRLGIPLEWLNQEVTEKPVVTPTLEALVTEEPSLSTQTKKSSVIASKTRQKKSSTTPKVEKEKKST